MTLTEYAMPLHLTARFAACVLFLCVASLAGGQDKKSVPKFTAEELTKKCKENNGGKLLK